jgi:hypothetical protein
MKASREKIIDYTLQRTRDQNSFFSTAKVSMKVNGALSQRF